MIVRDILLDTEYFDLAAARYYWQLGAVICVGLSISTALNINVPLYGNKKYNLVARLCSLNIDDIIM